MAKWMITTVRSLINTGLPIFSYICLPFAQPHLFPNHRLPTDIRYLHEKFTAKKNRDTPTAVLEMAKQVRVTTTDNANSNNTVIAALSATDRHPTRFAAFCRATIDKLNLAFLE